MNCPIKGLDKTHCPNCYFALNGVCEYHEIIRKRQALADKIMAENLNNAEGK